MITRSYLPCAQLFAIMPTTTEEKLSAVCTSCGLCCNGTLYIVAPLTRTEHDNLIAVLDVGTDQKGNNVLHLPCPALSGASCTMYETRPHICRSYRCGVLDSVIDGSLDQQQAVQLVTQARSLVATVAPLLPATAGAPKKTLCQRVNDFCLGFKKLSPEQQQATSPALLMAVGALQILLAKYFKVHELGVQPAPFKSATADERTP